MVRLRDTGFDASFNENAGVIALAMKLFRCLLLAALTHVIVGLDSAQAALPYKDVLTVTTQPHTVLSEGVFLLEDAAGSMGIVDVIKADAAGQFRRGSPAIGASTSAYWLRMDLSFVGDQPGTLWFDTGNRTIPDIVFYHVTPGKIGIPVRAGADMPYTKRPLPTPTFVFPMKLEGVAVHTVYLRVRSDMSSRLIVKPQVWTPAAYTDAAADKNLKWMLYLAFATGLILFNFLLYLSIRDTTYLLYILSALSIVWTVSSAQGGYGSAFAYFWPESPRFEQASWVLSALAGTIIPLLFITKVVGLRFHLPRLNYFIQILHVLLLAVGLFAVLPIVIKSALLSKLATTYAVSAIGFLCIVAIGTQLAGVIYTAAKGVRSAKIIALAWTPVIGAFIFFSIQTILGQTPNYLIVMWAAAIELLFMALALADRINQEKKARLQAQNALVEALKRSEKELEGKVATRTVELEETNTQLTAAASRVQNELALARAMQLALLPQQFPSAEDWKVHAVMEPALELGGDFYDFLTLPDGRIGILVADVSGKGVAAAFFMAVTRTVLLDLAITGRSPAQVMALGNDLLCQRNPMELFVTVCYVVFDPSTGNLEYASAGHPTPLRRASDGRVTVLPTNFDTALAVMPGLSYVTLHDRLETGETLLLYTDGVTEAFDPKGEAFGDLRLHNWFAQSRANRGADAIVDDLVSEVHAFVAGTAASDDLTCLILNRQRGECVMPVPSTSVAMTNKVLLQEFSLLSRLSEIERLADGVSAALPDRPDLAFAANLCLEELITNIITHGLNGAPDHIIQVRISLSDEWLEIVLKDDAPPFDPFKEVPEPDFTIALKDRPIGGLGVHLVKTLMDDAHAHYDGSGNLIVMLKTTRQPDRQTSDAKNTNNLS